MNTLEMIKSTLKMQAVFNRYGLQINGAGYVICPFHNEKTASLKAYKDNTRFHCFGCGAEGSVVDFVQLFYGIGFQQALLQICYDFGFPICKKTSIKECHEMRKRHLDIASKPVDVSNFWAVANEYFRLKQNFIRYEPKFLNQEFHKLFVEACQKLDFYEYLMLELAKGEHY